MSRIFITGSMDGLGAGAAQALIGEGHDVLLHSRSKERATAAGAFSSNALGVVLGDLSRARDLRSIADQVNAHGPMDAIIHNAGVYQEPRRGDTPEGHSTILAVNTIAPYVLTAFIDRPTRLIYLSSGMHKSGGSSLDDIDWRSRSWSAGQAYSESKLHVATIAAVVARHWPDVVSSAVDPGWVPTRMGGKGAPDDLEKGHLTQTWLAVSDDAEAKVSGRYWYHRRPQQAASAVGDPDFQERLIAKLSELTGVILF